MEFSSFQPPNMLKSTTVKTYGIPSTIPGVVVLQSSSFHQGDQKVFKHRLAGAQCTSISAVACCILSRKIEPVMREDLEKILIQGDQYYLQCKKIAIEADYLNVEDLLESFIVDDNLVILTYEDITYGRFCDSDLRSKLCECINVCCQRSKLSVSSGFLFTGQQKTVSFVVRPDNTFWLFNSHCVDVNNRFPIQEPSEGTARLFKCANPEALASREWGTTILQLIDLADNKDNKNRQGLTSLAKLIAEMNSQHNISSGVEK
ncbi:Protein of unknown function [Cotesia congregata]|uniref:Uncharacterized protein n=1 Tax=Cotesia congregata TaxID=51543 RepID=A0A8J2HER1_COTCN|nr:Protein of unknown function [Cotesia congregata]